MIQEYKVRTSKGVSERMTLADAIKRSKEINKGPCTILREGGSKNFHPHPDNAGKFYLYRIVR